MTDWVAFSEAATAFGTLVLAVATFATLRTSNRMARVAERALLAGLRPVLMPSWPDDPTQQVTFADGHVIDLAGDQPALMATTEVIYLALPLRNLGAGLAILCGYRIEADSADRVAQDGANIAQHRRAALAAPSHEVFQPQQRDLPVATTRAGFWQAALRDPAGIPFRSAHEAITTRGRLGVDLLYSDHEGGQPTITRFVLLPDGEHRWRQDATHHWPLTVLPPVAGSGAG